MDSNGMEGAAYCADEGAKTRRKVKPLKVKALKIVERDSAKFNGKEEKQVP
jgi:hypothetical protein